MNARYLAHLTALLLMSAASPSFACNQTLSTGANVSAAISGAAAGTTICLNAGNYGTVSITNVNKSSDVVVQSASGRTASLYARLNQSSRIKFQNLTMNGLEIDTNQNGGSKFITVAGNTFVGQAVLNLGRNSNANILIDGNTFNGINACGNCYEGRLQIISNPWSGETSGVTISNNHFGNAGESDGIQNGAYGVVISGNVFDGIKQGSYGRHVDAIQLYGASHTTIANNYFANGDTYIMAPDGGNTETIVNNTFIGYGQYYWKIQLGSHSNDVFSHNTVAGNIGVSIDKKVGSSNSSNVVVQNNLLTGGAAFKTRDSSGAESCTNCTFSFNLFDSTSSARGSNNVIGAPTFVGGANPTSWAGYQLASTSNGYRAGSDGKDMGTNYYGTGGGTTPPPATLAAPTNLRVQ